MTVHPQPQTGPRREPVFGAEVGATPPPPSPTAAPARCRRARARARPTCCSRSIVSSVRSVLFADEATVRLAVGCFVAGGHLLVEDFPGFGEDDAGQSPRLRLRSRLPPRAVHRRPPPRRHHRRHGVRRRSTRADVPARPRLHQRAHGRRAQPGVAARPVRAARGHGGATGHRGRPELRTARGRSWSSPRRTPTTLPALRRCPMDSATASCCGCRSGTRPVTTRTRSWPEEDPAVRVSALAPALSLGELQSLMDAVATRPCLTVGSRLSPRPDPRRPAPIDR